MARSAETSALDRERPGHPTRFENRTSSTAWIVIPHNQSASSQFSTSNASLVESPTPLVPSPTPLVPSPTPLIASPMPLVPSRVPLVALRVPLVPVREAIVPSRMAIVARQTPLGPFQTPMAAFWMPLVTGYHFSGGPPPASRRRLAALGPASPGRVVCQQTDPQSAGRHRVRWPPPVPAAS